MDRRSIRVRVEDGRAPGTGRRRLVGSAVAAIVIAGLLAAPAPVAALRYTATDSTLPEATAAAATPDRAALSPIEQGVVSGTLGRDDRRYWTHRDHTDSVSMDNPHQHVAARFDVSGALVSTGSGQWRLALSAVRRGDRLHQTPATAPVAEGTNRVVYRHGSIQEWWVNGPAGLQQGFTLPTRPDPGTGQLTLALGAPGLPGAKGDPGARGPRGSRGPRRPRRRR
jgi:hypothetical protein